MTPFPGYETVTTDIAGSHILKVTLNRPLVGNALNTQMGRDLLDLWIRLTEDPGEVRCVVLTGAGDKIFCAGGDLKERNGMSRQTWQRQHELFERMYWTMLDLPVPMIALLVLMRRPSVMGTYRYGRVTGIVASIATALVLALNALLLLQTFGVAIPGLA